MTAAIPRLLARAASVPERSPGPLVAACSPADQEVSEKAG